MYCPRLDHFVRFNPNGTVSRCGHMVSPPQFESLEQMDSSTWLADIKRNPVTWPKECVRCQQTEQINNTSIRLNAIEFDKTQTRLDYLTVGGVLDNICNSACQTCNQNLSTKIGSLISNDYPMIDNSVAFWQLPLERVVHLDINGGEPSASKNYRNILKNIPLSVTSVRINTNCSKVIPEIQQLLDNNVHVTYSNHFTRTADVPDELKNSVAPDLDNTVELQLWTHQQDLLRGVKLWDYYKMVDSNEFC